MVFVFFWQKVLYYLSYYSCFINAGYILCLRGRRPCPSGGNQSNRQQNSGGGNQSNRQQNSGGGNQSNRPQNSGGGIQSNRPQNSGGGNQSNRPQNSGGGNQSNRPQNSSGGNRCSRQQNSRGGHVNIGSRPQHSGHGHGGLNDPPDDSNLSVPNDGPSPVNQPQWDGWSQISQLSAHDARNLGRGYAGSSSNVGLSDPAADLQGVFRHYSATGVPNSVPNSVPNPDNESNVSVHDPAQDSNVADLHHLHGDKPYITKLGKKFASYEIHHQIRRVFDQHLDGAWPTFTQLPPAVLKSMICIFNFFLQTHYRWNSENAGAIETGFRNVVKDRYPDIMKQYQIESAKKAREAGYDIPKTDDDFGIMREFVPLGVDGGIWIDLCKYWDTDTWRKQSAAGRANRRSGDSTGSVSRHTGGSRGYDQYRVSLHKKLKRAPAFLEVFLVTHLTAEAKKKFQAGDYDTILDLEFCTTTAREVYDRYTMTMVERYGEDLSQHPEGDADFWKQSQEGRGRCRRIYGIGSSDLHFVVMGTSSNGNSLTSTDYQQSQQRVRELEQSQAEMMEKQAQMERQMAEMMELLKRFTNSPHKNPPDC